MKNLNLKGIPFITFAFLLVISIFLMYMPVYEYGDNGVIENVVYGGYIRNNFLISFSLLAVFGILFGEIGNRIPIWNKYIGGGTILVFFVASIFSTYGLLPETFLDTTKVFYNKSPVRFLELFIPALIVGSVLTVNRKILLKSIKGYLPLIIIGVTGATIGGSIVGLLFGKSIGEILSNYVLPIMGGGTGAGAIPMAEMWQSANGATEEATKNWLAFSLSILTIANIFAILTGALLNVLGQKKPDLTGNGQLLMDDEDGTKIEKEAWEDVKATQETFTGALIFTGILFAFSHFISEIWEQFVPAFSLHRLAVLVILVIFMNVLNIVPDVVKSGAKSMQTFFVKNTLWILMAAVGMSTNFQEIIDAFTPANALIALAIVLGATVSIMFTARIFKFYPIEAAISAGLCMANRGGSGDIAVLGAADRMVLISFAQISSRIGGAMMLITASILFGMF